MSKPRMRARVGLMLVLAAAVFVIIPSARTAAAPNIGPDPDDINEQNYYGNSYPGVKRQFKYAVSRDGYTDIYSTRIKIYLPTQTGTITVEDGDLCYNDSQDSGDPNYDQNFQQSTGYVTRFTMTNTGTGVITRNGSWNGSEGCWNNLLTYNVSGSSIDPATGMYPYFLDVDALANGKYVNLFKVNAPSGSYVSTDSTVDTPSFGMQQAYPIPPGSNPEVSDPPNPYKDYSTWTMRFGPDCSVTAPTVRDYVEIYDDDNSGANNDVQPRPFQIRMEEFTRSGTYVRDVYPTSVMWNSQNHTSPTTNSEGGWNDDLVTGGARYHHIWTVDNKRRLRAYFDFKKDMVYQWKLFNVYYDNTLQLRVPYDGVFYYRECQQPSAKLKAGMAAAPSPVSPGQSATFTPSIAVSSFTGSLTANCTIERRIYPPGGGSSSLGSQPCVTTDGNADIPINSSGIVTLRANTYNVPGSVEAGSDVCDAITITNPDGSQYYNTAGDKTAQACVKITAQPYVKVFGGDISAGNGLSTAAGVCTNNADAAVVSWNFGASGYTGAGAQYATYALDKIVEFATAQGNTGGAPPPSGLAFANSSVAAGTYGGSYGNLPCIPDYYAKLPADAGAYTGQSISSLGSGAFKATGPISFSGGDIINPGDRIQIFVDGDVYITDNIRYVGAWSLGKIPLFELVARGNIYVDHNVQQLDGLYIAQKTASGEKGTIYTCTTGAAPYTDFNNLKSQCSNKLTINGAFVANQVQLLRAAGTVGQAGSDNAATATSNAGEQFNFNPTLWIAQPEASGKPDSAGDYDAITTLPPIL